MVVLNVFECLSWPRLAQDPSVVPFCFLVALADGTQDAVEEEDKLEVVLEEWEEVVVLLVEVVNEHTDLCGVDTYIFSASLPPMKKRRLRI